MRIVSNIGLFCGIFLLGAGAATAGNITCSAALIDDPTIQAGSPPGCTQGNMQFSLAEAVITLGSEAIAPDTTSDFSDPYAVVIGAGSALGTGANSQMLQFYQVGQNISAGNTTGTNPADYEEYHFDVTIGVTDLDASDSIAGAYLAVNQVSLTGATVNNISESVCTGTTVYASCGSVTTMTDDTGGNSSINIPLTRAGDAAAQFDFDVLLPVENDTVSLYSFYMGFDESDVAPAVPEPSTFEMFGGALIGIVWLRRRMQR